uniref:ATP synthase complex subunit 8 n=1 Tax=Ateuchosaurus chinensis TaxID=2597157 RepID=A0A7U1AQW4_9SAUR|nr:ATP synthase F0 subunit 8 [Ateuchosaurus chinensis]QQY85228.1 ATP synthase F0 subunit 8 [Ateuchosaurus chinensis]
MPQLNPAPWLLIMLLSWAVLLMIFKTKTTASTQINTPTTLDFTTQHTTPWHWPWT